MLTPILRPSLSFRFPQNWGLGGLLLICCLCATAHAATLNVPTTAYPTIQAGINAAANDDTVLVADGTYTGDGNRDIDFNGKNITVKSVNGASKTIIDCQGTADNPHRGFYIHSGETNAVIDGFTVKNGCMAYVVDGVPDSGKGGGICIHNSDISVQNCTVSGNKAGEGGGVYNLNTNYNASDNYNGTIKLTNCTVSENTASGNGGGVYNYNYTYNYNGTSTITLTNCTVSNNIASGSNGGGVFNNNYSSSSITMIDCMVSGNMASGLSDGGGIMNYNSYGTITLSNCTVISNTSSGYGGGVENYNVYGNSSTLTTLINCTISGNTASYGGGIYNFDGDSNISVTNCIVYGDNGGEVANDANSTANAVSTYCDIKGGYIGTGNIDADPLFMNAMGSDFHLKTGSPCIGAGTASGAPATDLDGKTRPNPPSIGAYEAGAGPSVPATSSAVLLVHGTWSDASTWDAVMLPRLTAAGFTVEAVNFPTEPETLSNETYIELQAKALGRRIGELITRSGQPSVDLVCHSMGGLAARYYLTHPPLWQNGGTYAGVSKVVLLGTPLLGLDGSILDPVATVTNAHWHTQPLSADGYDSSAVDTYDNWSPAVKEMFSEWEPAPDDSDSIVNPYPANLLLSPWPKNQNGDYLDTTQLGSYAFADVFQAKFSLHPYGSDFLAVSGVLNYFLQINATNHISYYQQTAHELGTLYPDASSIWGVQSRRISPFLIDLNGRTDTSGAKICLIAGTFPVAYNPVIFGKELPKVILGPYVESLPNDGIVPTDSALGFDPLLKTYSLYPDATRLLVDTYHTDLPENDGVATQVIQWLQDIASDGWTSRAVTVGADGQTRLLWANIDGRAGLWSVDGTSRVSYGPTVGPYAGWTATQIAAGPDGLTRVLWNRPDGSAGLWLLNADNTVASTGTAYGPFDGWVATGIAVGTDNKTRILWAKSDGSMSYWTVDTSGNVSYSPTYGPYPGWTPQSISVGTDSAVHILWVSSDSSAALWAIDATGHVSYTPSYGPFTGWFPVGLATGTDNITHLLWNNVNNAASFWNIDSAGGISLSPVYGPYKGWFATQAAAGGDGQVRLLWTNANGEASFWLVDGAGDESYSPIFGPY